MTLLERLFLHWNPRRGAIGALAFFWYIKLCGFSRLKSIVKGKVAQMDFKRILVLLAFFVFVVSDRT